MWPLVAQLIAKIFSDNVLRWVATKALLLAFFTIVLPIVLNNFLYDIMDLVFTYVQNNYGTSDLNGAISFTGLAAWLITVTRLNECVSVVTGGYLLRLSLRHIPFLRF